MYTLLLKEIGQIASGQYNHILISIHIYILDNIAYGSEETLFKERGQQYAFFSDENQPVHGMEPKC